MLAEFTKVSLPDEFVDGLVELFDGVEIVFLDRVYDAGRHMLFKYHAAHRFDGRLDGRKLDKHFRAVATVLHHALRGFHVADYAAHPVENRFCMLRRMNMAVIVMMRSVAMEMRMCIFVTVLIYMSMLMKMLMRMSVTVFVLV